MDVLRLPLPLLVVDRPWVVVVVVERRDWPGGTKVVAVPADEGAVVLVAAPPRPTWPGAPLDVVVAEDPPAGAGTGVPDPGEGDVEPPPFPAGTTGGGVLTAWEPSAGGGVGRLGAVRPPIPGRLMRGAHGARAKLAARITR